MNLKLAFFLVVTLLLASACERNREPAPTPAATGLPEVTSTQPRSSATPDQTPTSVPTPGVGTPRPVASPTPERRADGLSFHFGARVGDFDRSLIERAVELTRELLRDESGLEPPADVFANESAAALALAFFDEGLEQSWRANGMVSRLSQTIAEASYRAIVITTGVPAWQAMDATQRLRAVAHEFVHVVQLEHAGLEVADETFNAPNTQAPSAGPFWLLEGSAEVVSWLVLQELGLGSYADALLDYARTAKGGSTDLSEMESFFGFSQAGSQGVGLSVLATDYLLRSRSLEGLFKFWTEIRRGAEWQTAFTRHFGVAPQFFYSAFAEYYKTVWGGVN
jgi:hypothetical protein